MNTIGAVDIGALNSVAGHQGSFAGMLGAGTGIGGAVVPLIIGRIGDYVGLRSGMLFIYVTFGIVLSVSFLTKPLVTNAIIDLKKTVPQPVADANSHLRPESRG
jgi:MFS transporter, FHS family, L-fucose permease